MVGLLVALAHLINKMITIIYGGAFSLTYYLKRDKRNNKSYPTKGYFYDFQFTQNGIGVLDKKIHIMRIIGLRWLGRRDNLCFKFLQRL